MLQGQCFVSRLDYLNLKSNHAKFQLNPIRNGLFMVRLEILQRCMNTAVLEGHCFDNRLDHTGNQANQVNNVNQKNQGN